MNDKLAKGNLYKVVLALCIPQMLAQFINVLYSIIDRLYVINYGEAGELMFTSIGICSPIITFITSFFYLVGSGGAPLFSILLGEGDGKRSKSILNNSFLLLVILGIVVPLIVFIFMKPLLNAFGATTNTIDYCMSYLRIYLISSPFSIVALGLNQFLVSEGHTIKAMATMIIGALANIILDPLFIFTFDMGLEGAAIASVLAQLISFAYVMFLIIFKNEIRLGFGDYNKKYMLRIITLGFAPFIISMTDSLCQIALNSSIKIHSDPSKVDSYIETATIVQSFYSLFSMPLLGISGGTGSVLSYNFGARNTDRVKKAEAIITLYGLIFTILALILSIITKEAFVNYFSNDLSVRSFAPRMIMYYMIPFVVLTFQYTFVDGLTAIGYAKYGIFLSLIRKISMIAFAYTLPFIFGIKGCFLSETFSDFLSSTITFVSFMLIFTKILNKRKNSNESVLE